MTSLSWIMTSWPWQILNRQLRSRQLSALMKPYRLKQCYCLEQVADHFSHTLQLVYLLQRLNITSSRKSFLKYWTQHFDPETQILFRMFGKDDTFVVAELFICTGTKVLPWPKKRTIIEIRGEKNAVPRVISCSIRRDQRRASPIRHCPRLFALRWSRLIEHDITHGTAFFSARISSMVLFLARVVDGLEIKARIRWDGMEGNNFDHWRGSWFQCMVPALYAHVIIHAKMPSGSWFCALSCVANQNRFHWRYTMT